MLISQIIEEKGRTVITALTTDSVGVAVERLAQYRVGAILIEDTHLKLVGIFSERDLVKLLGQHGAAGLERKLGDVMTTGLITCHAGDRIETAMTTMISHNIRHLPVVDEGKIGGMVSIRDLVRHRLEEKEQEAHVLLDISRMRG